LIALFDFRPVLFGTGFFYTGIISSMRWYRIAGICLLCLALIFGVVSIVIPSDAQQQVSVELPDGSRGSLLVNLPECGWAGDWALVSVKLNTVDDVVNDQPSSVRFKLETTDAEIQPEGSVQTVILPGEETSVSWKIRASRKGEINNILWVFFKGQGEDEQLIFAREFSYSSLYYGFLSPLVCRGIVSALAIIGVILILTVGIHNSMSKKEK